MTRNPGRTDRAAPADQDETQDGTRPPREADLTDEPHAPGRARLPAGTRLGSAQLQVADLERSLAFYQGVLGLEPRERSLERVELHASGGDRPLLILHQRPGARAVRRLPRWGLYHVALLLPERAELARFALHVQTAGVRVGAADHLVSEAFYLDDPDGLGIEIYADRPRSAWQRRGRELLMASEPLALADLVAAAGGEPWRGMPASASVGHVHLHVGDLAEASAFYGDAIGFEPTVWSYPGALFLAAGGYHHHLGVNTWAGADASPARAGDAKLREWTLELPRAADIAALTARLAAAGRPFERPDGDAVVADPWGTALRVRAVARS
jgi:catechol 2,3-dioxygenase